MTMIGHNNGPTMAPGAGFRRHAWARARRELLPRMPLEVIRMRMRRADQLGLDFKTYATVRATTGRDVIAFLFSTNGLAMIRPSLALAPDRAAGLSRIRNCGCHIGLAAGLEPDQVIRRLSDAGITPETLRPLPHFAMAWSEIRSEVKSWLASERIPGDGVLMIGEGAFEREIATAGGLAGLVSGNRYFATEAKT